MILQILTWAGITAGAIWFSTFICLWHNYRYYKPIYDLIKHSNFYKYKDQLWIRDDETGFSESAHDFVWFLDKKQAMFCYSHHIHNAFYTYFDPYSLYWLLKYQRFFKNLDPKRIYPSKTEAT